jgi:hypothetical protein
MPETTYSLSPLWAEIKAEVRDWRDARATRRALRRDLAWATTAADLRELDAMIERYHEDDTVVIRDVLSERRFAGQLTGASFPGR